MTLRFRRHFVLRCASALLALAIAAPADLLAASSSAPTSDAVNLEVMTQIRQEGFHNSKVMEIEG